MSREIEVWAVASKSDSNRVTRVLSSGQDRIRIEPRPTGTLTHVSAKMETRHGRLACAWKPDDAELVFHHPAAVANARPARRPANRGGRRIHPEHRRPTVGKSRTGRDFSRGFHPRAMQWGEEHTAGLFQIFPRGESEFVTRLVRTGAAQSVEPVREGGLVDAGNELVAVVGDETTDPVLVFHSLT